MMDSKTFNAASLRSVYSDEAKFREDFMKVLKSLVHEVKELNKKMDVVNEQLKDIAYSSGINPNG